MLESVARLHFMKRSIVVGILAAAFGVLLISLLMFLEMRYSEYGVFMREWAANGRPTGSFDDTMNFMAKWVHFNQFILSPTASVLVGLLVGGLCRNRYLVGVIIGVAPIVAVNYPSDVLSVTAALFCIFVAWLGAKGAQTITKHFSIKKQAVATT